MVSLRSIINHLFSKKQAPANGAIGYTEWAFYAPAHSEQEQYFGDDFLADYEAWLDTLDMPEIKDDKFWQLIEELSAT